MSSSFGAWQAREWEAGRDPSWIHDDPLAYRRLMERCRRQDAGSGEPTEVNSKTPSSSKNHSVAALTISTQSHGGTE